MKKLFPNNKVLSPNKSYDEIAKMVNDKIKEDPSISTKDVDDELNLPSGTSWDMSGSADYYNEMYDDK